MAKDVFTQLSQLCSFKVIGEAQWSIECPESVNRLGRQSSQSHFIQHIGKDYNGQQELGSTESIDVPGSFCRKTCVNPMVCSIDVFHVAASNENFDIRP